MIVPKKAKPQGGQADPHAFLTEAATTLEDGLPALARAARDIANLLSLVDLVYLAGPGEADHLARKLIALGESITAARVDLVANIRAQAARSAPVARLH